MYIVYCSCQPQFYPSLALYEFSNVKLSESSQVNR